MSFLAKYRSIIIVAILIVIFVITLSLIVKPYGHTGFFRKIVLEVTSPLQNMVNSSVSAVRSVWERYLFLVDLGEENRQLNGENALLSNQLNSYREAYLECQRLKKLLGLREIHGFQTVAAKVVGRERSSVFKTILINRGSSDGLSEGQAVVAFEGVVGRVIEVSWNVSKILLLIDYNSNIDAIVQNIRAQGILQGSGQQGCVLKYVHRAEDVKVGDSVVCSGMAGVFPRGILLGTVASVDKEAADLFQKIRVTPAVHVSKLEEVLVVVNEGAGQ